MASAIAMPEEVNTALDPNAPEFMMPQEDTSNLFSKEALDFKPFSDISMRAEAAEFIPMVGGWATLQAAAEALQQKQKRQMPFATDDEWETRIAKREREVQTLKSLQSYRLYAEVFPRDERGDDDPKTPDPRDRTVSKRMWKWNVEKWRLQLKSRCVYSRNVMIQSREFLLRCEREGIRPPEDRDGSEEQASAMLTFTASRLAGVQEPPGIVHPGPQGLA